MSFWITQHRWKYLDNKEEGAVNNNVDNSFENLVRTNLKQLPNRLKLACQNEFHQVVIKYIIAAENVETLL